MADQAAPHTPDDPSHASCHPSAFDQGRANSAPLPDGPANEACLKRGRFGFGARRTARTAPGSTSPPSEPGAGHDSSPPMPTVPRADSLQKMEQELMSQPSASVAVQMPRLGAARGTRFATLSSTIRRPSRDAASSDDKKTEGGRTELSRSNTVNTARRSVKSLGDAGRQRSLTLTGITWGRLPRTPHSFRTHRDVWEDSTADVGSLYAQGVRSIGKLFFPTDEEMQQEYARFASVEVPGADADCAVKLLLSYWRIEKPSVLIAVTGSAQRIELEPRLEHFLEVRARRLPFSKRPHLRADLV